MYRARETGRPAAGILPGLIEQALRQLPVARRMRWGDGEFEFVRPVHWILLLLGTETVAGTIGIAPDPAALSASAGRTHPPHFTSPEKGRGAWTAGSHAV